MTGNRFWTASTWVPRPSSWPDQVPPVPVREVITILAALGFEDVRQRGSHKQFRHAVARATTVPVPGRRDLSPILLRPVARDVGLTVHEFVSRRR